MSRHRLKETRVRSPRSRGGLLHAVPLLPFTAIPHTSPGLELSAPIYHFTTWHTRQHVKGLCLVLVEHGLVLSQHQTSTECRRSDTDIQCWAGVGVIGLSPKWPKMQSVLCYMSKNSSYNFHSHCPKIR